MSRRDDLDRFYKILDDLKTHVGGCRQLRQCTARSGWPERGVYFFFEAGETREDGKTARVVRVGTHAISATSKTTLWNRLHTHRGHSDRGGNHRGSIFRKRIGEALLNSREYAAEIGRSWGSGSSAPPQIVGAELKLEQDVSDYIGEMPLLWLEVDDAPSPTSLRSYLERNSIALLSNFHKDPVDSPSARWLGTKSSQGTIRNSGLWNTNYVDEQYEPRFLEVLQTMVSNVKPLSAPAGSEKAQAISGEPELAPGWSMKKVEECLTASAKDSLVVFLRERYESRFLRPIVVLQSAARNAHGFGFSIMSLCSLLIESLQCYADGLPTTHRGEYQRLSAFAPPPEFEVPKEQWKDGSQVFKDFFNSPRHHTLFSQVDGSTFYSAVRNGLLHQAQTKQGWSIRTGRSEVWDTQNKIVDRNKFVTALKQSFEEYLNALSAAGWDDDIWRKARRKIWWLIKLSG